MVDVGGNDGAACGNLVAHEFGRDEIGNVRAPGLAGMLVGIGVLMVTSRQVLDRFGGGGEKLAWALRLLPPLSAICVAVVGRVIAWKAWTQGMPGIGGGG